MTEKATIKIHVCIDEHGNASAMTDFDLEEGCSYVDGLEGNTREFCIEVTATRPASKPGHNADPVASVDVPDEAPQPEGEVTAGVAA